MYHFCCPNVLDKYYCRVISSKKITNLLGSGLGQDYSTQHKFFQGFEKKSLKKNSQNTHSSQDPACKR